MAQNYNIETGIQFGYISANAMDSDIVSELLDNGTDLDAQAAYAEWLENKIEELIDSGECDLREDAESEADSVSYEFWESYESYEPSIEGVKDGVMYASSWLGGALNFFILQSPHITDSAHECSICVPNAGSIDTLDGRYTCYDVPPRWRRNSDDD